MSTIQFGTFNEKVISAEEYPLAIAKQTLQNETIAILGYGVQGPAQALNLKDNRFNVIVGQRDNSPSWEQAIRDGWEPAKNLFSLEEACKQATFICYLLSDAGQMDFWPVVKRYLTPGKTLYFSHGFAVTYRDQTNVIPPGDIDVILVAPKGSGRSVRQKFLEGRGINSSYAIFQDYTGMAEKKALAFGVAIGSGYLFQTSFEQEVYSDLFGERGVLMGALAGMIEAQYQVLRKYGHSPTESFNETVEELTQSLIPLIAERGMDWMFSHCSTTAQRGALDWLPKFKAAVMPIFEGLYESVVNGTETKNVLSANRQQNYRHQLQQELAQMAGQEIWQVGAQLRKLRSNYSTTIIVKNRLNSDSDVSIM